MANILLAVLIPLSALPARPSAFQEAYRQSISRGRPLVVLLGADWCAGCRVMKGRVLPRVAKAGGLANVEYIYVNIDRQRRLADGLLRGKVIPQLIRFRKTPSGWERRQLTGTHSVEEVKAFINAELNGTDISVSHYSELI